MLSIAVGSIFALLGVVGIWGWRWDFLTVIKGGLPVCLFLGGVLAVIAGVSTIKSESPVPSVSPTPSSPSSQKSGTTSSEPEKK